LRELAARSLDLLRVGIVAAPILHQSIYLHEVSFCLWFFRVLVIYALLGTVTILFIPEQVYKGVGLNTFRTFLSVSHLMPKPGHKNPEQWRTQTWCWLELA